MHRKFQLIFLTFCALFLLNACGGGGGGGGSTPILNSPPVAQISVPSNIVNAGDSVALSGSQSSDPNRDALTYTWEMISPANPALLSALQGPTTTLTTEVAANDVPYTVRLTVSDGSFSNAKEVTITARGTASNVAPTAALTTASLQIQTGTQVTLDASGSSDPNGDALLYRWQLTPPAGSSATLPASTGGPQVSFSADLDGDYLVTLRVSDGALQSPAVNLTITAAAVLPNQAPVAVVAPATSSVQVGTVVGLGAGQSTDPDNDPLSYLWAIVSAPPGSLSALSTTTGLSTFITPDLAGTYQVSLAVNDGRGGGSQTLATITAIDPEVTNNRPVAAATVNAALISPGSDIVLDGSGSFDEDGDPLTYEWSYVQAPVGHPQATIADTPLPAAITADQPGQYIFQLIVRDSLLAQSDPVSVEVTVNAPPQAIASAPASGITGTNISLNGSASSDPDNGPDPLSYSWSVVDGLGAAVAVSNATLANASFVPVTEGSHIATLEVSDGLDLAQAQATITISPPPNLQQPVADAGPGGQAAVGAPFALDGSGSSDLDGDPLTFAWSFAGVPATSTLTDVDINQSGLQNDAAATFTPDVGGTYQITLVVNDGALDSAPSTTTVIANTPPVADAGPDRTVGIAVPVALNAGRSSDADGDNLTFTWALTGNPGGDALTGLTGRTSSFTPTQTGVYTVSLTVNDGTAAPVTDTATITVIHAFARTFGGVATDFGGPAIELPGGSGYAMGGESSSPSIALNGGFDMVLVRTDANGVAQSAPQVYGGPQGEEFWNLDLAATGNFLLAGFSNSFGSALGDLDGNGDAFLVETDSTGNQVFGQAFGGSGLDQGQAVRATSDGGVILAGYSESIPFALNVNDTAMYVLKFVRDAQNNLIPDPAWISGPRTGENAYGGSTFEDCWGVVEKSGNNGFILAGFTDSFADLAEGDAYLVEIDAAGNQISDLSLGQPGFFDELYDLQPLGNNQYVAAGYTESLGDPGGDFYLVRFSNPAPGQLTIDLERGLGGSSFDEARGVTQTSDGGFALGGFTSSITAGQADIMLIKTDAAGVQQWLRTYGGTGDDKAWSVRQTSDDGFLLGGDTSSFGSGQKDLLLLKTDPDGRIAPLALPFQSLTQNEGTVVNIATQGNFIKLNSNLPGMTFAAIGLPAGTTLSPATGVITGTLPQVGADTTFRITVIATNSEGLSAAETLNLTVKNIP